MKVVYLTHADAQYIYEDLKQNGYYEWYITLKIIDELQIDYTFLSKLTWSKLLDSETIVDTSGNRDKVYRIPLELKMELNTMIHILDVENYDDKIVTTRVADLYEHLLKTYDSIKKYKENGIVFRIDFFKDYTIDINGVKTYSMKEISDKDDEEIEDDEIKEAFLYIAVQAHIHDDQRPEEFRTKFWDKKIGKSRFVKKRMNDLSKDKRHGGTKSPLYVKALRIWAMPTKVCHRLEKELHKIFEERNTSGEWYSDFYEDIIKIVEKRIKELINKEGVPIVKVKITKDNQDVTFIDKLDLASWEKMLSKNEVINAFEYKL